MRKDIIKNLKSYFAIKELVDNEVFALYGEEAWQFFTTDILETLLFIREGLAKPITINNGTNFTQRGLRTNQSPLVKTKTKIYLSAHILGRAFDLDVAGMGAEEVRSWLFDNKDKLPHPIRLEHINSKTKQPITWVHIDTIDNNKGQKVYFFNV